LHYGSRRITDMIEALGELTVQDITFGTQINEHGRCRDLTVHFRHASDADELDPIARLSP
jgi:hypothetical protein